MPWLATIPGAGLARLLAIEKLLKDNITSLGDSFTNSASFGTSYSVSTDVSFLITRYGAPTAAHVFLGDMESTWDIKDGFCRLYVTSGNHRSGIENTAERAFIGNSTQFRDTFTTSIFGYLHQNAFRQKGTETTQEREREVAQEILSDWLRAAVLNYFDNHALTLLSQERWDVGDSRTDVLSLCQSQAVTICTFNRGIGASTVAYGIHATHTGVLQ